MPSLLELVLHADRRRPPPAPLPVSLRPVFALGTVAWLVAVVVTALLAAAGHVPATSVWITATGAAFGGLGVLWARRHDRRAPAAAGPASGDAASDDAATDGPPSAGPPEHLTPTPTR